MLTPEEIERRKAILRADPATKKICALLGITMERFLQDIEKPRVLIDRCTDEERERSKRAVVEIAVRCFEEAREELESAAFRNDRWLFDDHHRRARRVVGIDR